MFRLSKFRKGVPHVGNTNAHAQNVDLARWSNCHAGIPRKDRAEVTQISQFYESKTTRILKRGRCNNFRSNQYMVIDKESKKAFLIDMSDDWPDDWVELISMSGLDFLFIFFTHLHIDNVIGLHPFVTMREKRGLQTFFAYNPSDLEWMAKFRQVCDRYKRKDMSQVEMPLPRRRLNAVKRESDIEGKCDLILNAFSSRQESFFMLGNTPCQYIHTPGHSQGHCCLYMPTEKILFSGDLLYKESVGRVDLPWACGDLLAHSLRMLEDFHDETVVLPGHGQATTMGWERKNNAALRRVYEMLNVGFKNPRVGVNEGG
eukprot:PhF_6_TR20765/c0_g1_i1/m.29798